MSAPGSYHERPRILRPEQRAARAEQTRQGPTGQYVHPSLASFADTDEDEPVLQIVSSKPTGSKRPDWWKALTPAEKKALAVERREARRAELEEAQAKAEERRLAELTTTQRKHERLADHYVRTGHHKPTGHAPAPFRTQQADLSSDQGAACKLTKIKAEVPSAPEAQQGIKRPQSWVNDVLDDYDLDRDASWQEVIENAEWSNGREWFAEGIDFNVPFPTRPISEDRMQDTALDRQLDFLRTHNFNPEKRKTQR